MDLKTSRLKHPAPPTYIDEVLDAKGRKSLEITILDDLRFELPPDGDLWLLPRRMCVPAGYISDGASVPRFFWRVLSPNVDPVTLAPSIVHDWLYDNSRRYNLCRLECDIWYYYALMENGYPLWKCELTYWAIRLFGWMHWRRK